MTSDTPSQAARAGAVLRDVRDALEEAQIALNGGPNTQGLHSQIEAALRSAHYALSASPPAEALPSQTSGAGAGGDVDWKRIAGERRLTIRELITERNDALERAVSAEALAKPASEPAGGGVRGLLPEDQPHAWPALKKALWLVVTGEQLNDGRYVNAYELTDKLYAASLSSPASSSPAEATQFLATEDGEFNGNLPEAEALQTGVEAVREAAMLVCAEAVAIGKGMSMAVSKEAIENLRASLSSAPAQEDGSKDLGAHPRAIPTSPWQDIATAPHGVEVLLGWWDDDGLGGSNWATEIGCASFGWRRGSISNMSRHSHATHWQPIIPPSKGDGP